MKEMSREELKEAIAYWEEVRRMEVKREAERVLPVIVSCILHDRYMIQIPQKAGLGFNVA